MTAVDDRPAVNDFMPGMTRPEPNPDPIRCRRGEGYGPLDDLYVYRKYMAEHLAEHPEERPDGQPFVNDDGVIQFPNTYAADNVTTVMQDKREARRALVRSMDRGDAEAVYQVAVEGAYIDPWNALLSMDDETLTWVLHRAAEEAAEFRRMHAAEISQLIAEASNS